jgi:hypothetical protein
MKHTCWLGGRGMCCCSASSLVDGTYGEARQNVIAVLWCSNELRHLFGQCGPQIVGPTPNPKTVHYRAVGSTTGPPRDWPPVRSRKRRWQLGHGRRTAWADEQSTVNGIGHALQALKYIVVGVPLVQ